LREKAAAAKGSQAVALAALLRYWKAVEGVGFSLALEKDVAVSLAIRANPDGLPVAARPFLGSPGKVCMVWSVAPEPAIVAAAGRLDSAAVMDLVADFLDEGARRSLREAVDRSVGAIVGKDVVPQVLRSLGPDWAFFITPPPAEQSAWMPDVVAAMRVQDGPDRTAPAGQALLNVLSYAAALVVLNQNGGRPGPLSLRFVMQDGVEVHYLVHEEKFPPGFRPAFAIKGGYLVLASSPDAFRRFHPPTSSEAARVPETGPPLFRLSVRDLREYLRTRRAALVEYSERKDGISREEAGRRLDGLLAVLHLLDRIELRERRDPGRVILTPRLTPSEPLK
jgi:hypothetical protein